MSHKTTKWIMAVALLVNQAAFAQQKAPEQRTGEKPSASAVNPPETQKQPDTAAITKPAETKAAATATEAKAEKSDKLPVGVTYGDKGLTFDTGDGKFGLSMQHRLQFRYAYPFDADPRQLSDLDAEGHSFMVRRARFKVNGYAYKKWLKYNMQYDWSQPVLRDFSIDVARFSWATLRIGRAKVLYNDERVASSGRQQFVNRSILNDVFTVDRQQGVQLIGRVLENTPADFNYMVGVFSGRGVGERLNDDANLMYAARLQWNAVGDPIEFSQSDDKYTQRWNLNIAFGAATNKSNCTAFETDAVSCRRLPGTNYPTPASTPGAQAGQFKVDQGVFEVRSVYKGIYFKHESHVKRIIDNSVTINAYPREAEMWGALVQLGYFPHAAIDAIPSELEIAGRVAWVDPNINVSGNNQSEYTGILNWFANSHNNKISFEVSHLVLQNPAGGNSAEQRYRSQWEFSF